MLDLLDLKKALDTVDHNIPVKKLKLYGIKGNTARWFRSYLTERSQFVEYNNCKSQKKQLTHGIPKGSILGLYLFIIYICENCYLEQVEIKYSNKLTLISKCLRNSKDHKNKLHAI